MHNTLKTRHSLAVHTWRDRGGDGAMANTRRLVPSFNLHYMPVSLPLGTAKLVKGDEADVLCC